MCNEYQQRFALSLIDDAFAQIKIPFHWAEPPAEDRKVHIFPKYDTVVLRPTASADPWAGFEGVPMRWGVFSHLDKKTGKAIEPNNCRDDKIEAHPWRYAYAERRCLIPVTQFMEFERPEGWKPGGAVKAIKHTVQLASAIEEAEAAGRTPRAYFPAIWQVTKTPDRPEGFLTVANVTGPAAPDVPFHGRLARLVSLRDGVAWCDLQGQGIGALKVTPPAGTYRLDYGDRTL